ncbi:Re/Si-specific NAD(P)(+) transhydrogenase subunit alpha [Oceanithermus desulfurans]|uniref:NAD(P) transhydrogenase subunit alpha part 1 n=2 Tax=Oceanithermus desulfurans TaxID=227924 RepID=A0A511RG72_9DEIN|nr:Re/Si-specific NAD(P)(+) transhydrogenase subunit alpha [Oceanithermus desulfurans]MBB6030093.1 NAD(P) transhydrogenase subunit alpha [Oceanithermus desulfurans]GEM88651.1 NAD(P) transhydrogenase subunit alpha [Oceanithermus desulfurans NBRC 100063]
MAIKIAVPKEEAPGERRVALVPEVAGKLVRQGHAVAVESGAGVGAHYLDDAYEKAGAQLVEKRTELLGGAQIVLKVQPPTEDEIDALPEGAVLIGFMYPHRYPERVAKMRDKKLTVFAMELVPRITRAQAMDALSSQATVAGYKAALIAADTIDRFLPMLTTAAGTIRPAQVLVLGAGVAGLQAIATAKRLGAVVSAYDVRRAAGEQVRSLGAKFLELEIDAEAEGGYARELTEEEKAKERAMVEEAIVAADIVITTANIPGRRAPILVTKEMVERMKPGSVIVDLAAESGGNCEVTKPGETVQVGDVRVVGPLNLPSALAVHASEMYAKNLHNFLELILTEEGGLELDWDDEILAGSVLVHDGEIKHAPTRELVEGGAA